MPDQTAPNTAATASAIQTIAQAITISPPVSGISGYKTVTVGASKDYANLLPLLEITGADDETERASMNAVGQPIEIDDSQWFYLATTVDYTDSNTAELVLFALRDALTQACHSSAHLNNTAGVHGAYLEKPGKYGYKFQNGVWYRVHQTRLRVLYLYKTTMVV